MKRSLPTILIGAFLLGAIGFLGYWAVSSDYAYFRSENHVKDFERLLSETPSIRYGTITEVNPVANTMTIRTPSSYQSGAYDLIRIQILSDALISREDLTLNNGAYEGFTRSAATIHDLGVGSKVKVIGKHSDKNEIVASVVFVGNPF